MKPSHLESGWVHFGWAALPNAAFPSPSVLHKSTEGWKLRESGGSALRRNSGRIYSTKHRERKKKQTSLYSGWENFEVSFYCRSSTKTAEVLFLKKKKKKLWNDKVHGAPTRYQIHLASKSEVGKKSCCSLPCLPCHKRWFAHIHTGPNNIGCNQWLRAMKHLRKLALRFLKWWIWLFFYILGSTFLWQGIIQNPS